MFDLLWRTNEQQQNKVYFLISDDEEQIFGWKKAGENLM